VSKETSLPKASSGLLPDKVEEFQSDNESFKNGVTELEEKLSQLNSQANQFSTKLSSFLAIPSKKNFQLIAQVVLHGFICNRSRSFNG